MELYVAFVSNLIDELNSSELNSTQTHRLAPALANQHNIQILDVEHGCRGELCQSLFQYLGPDTQAKKHQ